MKLITYLCMIWHLISTGKCCEACVFRAREDGIKREEFKKHVVDY